MKTKTLVLICSAVLTFCLFPAIKQFNSWFLTDAIILVWSIALISELITTVKGNTRSTEERTERLYSVLESYTDKKCFLCFFIGAAILTVSIVATGFFEHYCMRFLETTSLFGAILSGIYTFYYFSAMISFTGEIIKEHLPNKYSSMRWCLKQQEKYIKEQQTILNQAINKM